MQCYLYFSQFSASTSTFANSSINILTLLFEKKETYIQFSMPHSLVLMPIHSAQCKIERHLHMQSTLLNTQWGWGITVFLMLLWNPDFTLVAFGFDRQWNEWDKAQQSRRRQGAGTFLGEGGNRITIWYRKTPILYLARIPQGQAICFTQIEHPDEWSAPYFIAVIWDQDGREVSRIIDISSWRIVHCGEFYHSSPHHHSLLYLNLPRNAFCSLYNYNYHWVECILQWLQHLSFVCSTWSHL